MYMCRRHGNAGFNLFLVLLILIINFLHFTMGLYTAVSTSCSHRSANQAQHLELLIVSFKLSFAGAISDSLPVTGFSSWALSGFSSCALSRISAVDDTQ